MVQLWHKFCSSNQPLFKKWILHTLQEIESIHETAKGSKILRLDSPWAYGKSTTNILPRERGFMMTSSDILLNP